MTKIRWQRKALAALMSISMAFSALPAGAFAAEGTGTFEKITEQAEFTTGKYVMTVDTDFAVEALSGNWLPAAEVDTSADTLTDPASSIVWDITVDGETAVLTDANGVTVAPKGGNANGISKGDYVWDVTFADGTFQFHGVGDDTVTLASNKSSENKFRAYKDSTIAGQPGRYPCDFTLYKLEGGGTEEPGPSDPDAPIADGEEVVIYNPAYGKALSATYTGHYNNGTDVTVGSDGTLSGYSATDVWTVTDNGDGTWSFSYDGQKISMGDEFTSMPLDEKNDKWELVEAEDGLWYVRNTVRDAYMEWYDSKDNWSAYYNISTGSEDMFALAFYKAEGEDPGPSDPDAPIADGEEVVIYNPAYGKALSATYTGHYNKGTDVTVGTDGTLSGYSASDVWTVIDNGDGTWSFSYDGQNIGMGDDFTSMPLGEKNDKWELVEAGDGLWYIRNTVRDAYMEWYDSNNNWSAYYNISAGSEGMFALAFYKTEGEDPGPSDPEAPIADGEEVVIYNPAYGKALSGSYSGYYNNGTDVTVGTDGTLSGYSASDVWTVIDNGDGTWSFSYDGQNIGMGDDFTSMPLGEKNDKWELVEAGDGLWYIRNTVRDAYMEWYDSNNNWSAYYNINAGSEDMFALAFYKVTGDIPEPGGDLPEAGDQVVLYNLSAQGVLAGQDDNAESPSIENAPTELADGAAVPGNGAAVFTVERNGEYYRFHNESYGYLCSNGTGNNAFYSKEASEDADWTLAVLGSGYSLESRTAKFNGRYSQYLEYYGGSFKTYSMYNVTDYDIYTFLFCPLAEGVNVTEGVVNVPTVTFGVLTDAFVGTDYTVTFTVDAVFGVQTVSAQYGGTTVQPVLENGVWSFTIPGSALTEGTLELSVSGTDSKGAAFLGMAALTVKDEPVITAVSPDAGAETGEDKRPVVSVTFANAGESPAAKLTLTGSGVTVADGADMTIEGNTASYTPAAGLADGRYTAAVTVTRTGGKSASRTWSFTVGEAAYQLYFGQLHSHTTYSDGSGSLESALDYVSGLPESANVDFVAFTDHSNYFDSTSSSNPEQALYDKSQMTGESLATWEEYKGAVADFNAEHAGELVALAGFEMTWSGGPGHINTFNTEGLVSRNNDTLNSKTSDAGLKAYYSLLSQAEGVDSINQFNHPGTTFGNFVDFAYWDPVIDTRIQLVEVGNGEGAIGAGGYYPSYEQYIMALDKGWHVGPTNNQDNHKGKWGNANDARDVILTDDFSEEGIYQAIRDRRIYATEDKNLEIQYSLNGQMLGSIIDDDSVETAEIAVSVYDPDAADSIARVEVVVNSGAVAYTWDDPAELASGELTCTIPADYSYYFIRVTQGDGDLAVTAPVWVGETLKLGISSVECGTENPVTDEPVTITTNLFNSETEAATVDSITYTSGGETLYTDTTGYTVDASGGTLAVEWTYTPTQARLTTITVTVTMTQGGTQYTYSMDVTLDVLDAEKLVYIGIDASHYNEYVNGNYKDSMGNFGNLAAGHLVRTVELETSGDLISACENADGKYKAIILTAPSRRLAEAQSDPQTYSQEELDALAAFNAAGGMVILAGWSDNYENYPVIQDNPNIKHMAATQNEVLEALGSSLRIGDDATYDDEYSAIDGVDPWRLYFNTYNWDSFLVDGVDYDPENPYNDMYTQLYSHYGGATVYAVDGNGDPTSQLPATVTPVVYAHESTYSVDVDKDGLGGDIPEYPVSEGDDRLMVLATEQLEGKGLIIVSGAAFMSNFEVQADVDNAAEKNYSNYDICENLVEYLNPVTVSAIADVQAEPEEGVRYTIKGVVTSNASGYDRDTAFFDCIYVQDDTAGVNAFPVAGDFKIGDIVRITGTTSSYQGERQIAVDSIEKVGEDAAPAPEAITAAQLNDGSVLGSLVTLEGTVTSFQEENGLVQTIMVRDENGDVGRVFIDGYITTDQDVEGLEVGCAITATGLASYDNTFDGPAPRIRIRDRADVVCTEAPEEPDEPTPEPPETDEDRDPENSSTVVTAPGQSGSSGQGGGTEIGEGETPLAPTVFTDVPAGAWYSGAVSEMVERGLMQGVSGGLFAPNQTVSRAMAATVLYRMSGETYSGSGLSFPDAESGSWYAEAAAWANEAGIVTGYDTGIFAPNDPVTREQLAAMLSRYQAHKGAELSGGASLDAFPDGAQVSAYARDAMSWAVGAGLLQGRDGGLLAPAGQSTRAELATILSRFLAMEG